MGWVPPPQLLEPVERQEREARLRLEDARDRAPMNEDEAPSEHRELIHKLAAEWKHAACSCERPCRPSASTGLVRQRKIDRLNVAARIWRLNRHLVCSRMH